MQKIKPVNQKRIKYTFFLIFSLVSVYALLTINCQNYTSPIGNKWVDAIELIYLGFACSGNWIKLTAVGLFTTLAGVMVFKLLKTIVE